MSLSRRICAALLAIAIWSLAACTDLHEAAPVPAPASDAAAGTQMFGANGDAAIVPMKDASVATSNGGNRAQCAPACATGVPCTSPSECASGACVDGTCRPDCSPQCGERFECVDRTDCAQGRCRAGQCRPACSGDCILGDACVDDDDCASQRCLDQVCRPACAGSCGPNAACASNEDCRSGICADRLCRNECDGLCELGQPCVDDAACASGTCRAGICRPTCTGACLVGASCTAGDDCTGGVCIGGKCRPACSGSCGNGQGCVDNGDCASLTCMSSACRPACRPESCNDLDDDCDGTIDEGVTNRCGKCAEEPDLQSDATNCGTCGHRCGTDETCESGRCAARSICGDGVLDLALGEQCDPGRDVGGCMSCRITGAYGDSCTSPGMRTTEGACYNFGLGNGMGGSPPMVMPTCHADGSCPGVPGSEWPAACLVGGLCLLTCTTDADCPPQYDCWQALHCWKF